jgi:hypothetical protein
VGWKIYDEAVDMAARRFQYFPRVFRWRGRRYEVETLKRSWTVVRPGWRRRVQRRYFEVSCAEGSFELYQDLASGAWYLRRARLTPIVVPALVQMAPAYR